MALYCYVKKEKPGQFELWLAQLTLWWQDREIRRGIAGTILLVGFFLLANGILPIISYQIRYAPRFSPIYSPIPEGDFWRSSFAASAQESKDYTLIGSWFIERPGLEREDLDKEISYYNLAIPVLGIKNAIVHVGGEDLKKELVQYPNTAVPGEFGNTVIFGHSVLPQFFNPENYITIFSTLFKLKNGDEIIVHYDGVRYVYRVEDIFEVLPTDLTVLSQRFEGKMLTLITCTPPGTYLRRLVVRARLGEGFEE